MKESDDIVKRIIIVEDDCSVGECIAKYLQLKGWDVTIACSAVEFYKIIDRRKFALAIIDIGLPDQSGLVLVDYLSSNAKTRIIIISGKPTAENRVEGYRCGADHFLAKPLNFQELGSIVSNMMKRFQEDTEDGYNSVLGSVLGSKWRLIPEEWSLITPSGKELRLTAKEYAFICCLAEAPRGIVSRSCLMKSLGYMQNEYGHRSLESLVYRLRKKISPTLDTPIKTASGSGYTFTSVLELDG